VRRVQYSYAPPIDDGRRGVPVEIIYVLARSARSPKHVDFASNNAAAAAAEVEVIGGSRAILRGVIYATLRNSVVYSVGQLFGRQTSPPLPRQQLFSRVITIPAMIERDLR